MDLTLRQLCSAVRGSLHLGADLPADFDPPLVRLETDSRAIRGGDVFLALIGHRRDGADFIDEAFARGASGAITSSPRAAPPAEGWVLEVADPVSALWDLARGQRARFAGSVIAVAGAVGKSTTCGLIRAVLGGQFTTTATPSRDNDHVGVPLAMLAARDEDFAVWELAGPHRGGVSRLAELCQPHVAVVTSLGGATGKGESDPAEEILAHVAADGCAVLIDHPELRRTAQRAGVNALWVGRRGDCDLSPTHVESSDGELRFRVEGHRFAIPIRGRHHLGAALLALGVGRTQGLSLGEMADSLADPAIVPGGCPLEELAGATLLAERGGAHPEAMRAALRMARELESPGRRIVVCGAMRDAAAGLDDMHRRLGDEIVTACGADLLVACGEHGREVVAAALAAGMPPGRAIAYDRPCDAGPLLRRTIRAGDVVLVHGGADQEFDELLATLRQQPPLAVLSPTPRKLAA